jgi:hypothetical protein
VIVSVSFSINYCLPALSGTIWHESNHHPLLNQSSMDTILTLLITLQVGIPTVAAHVACSEVNLRATLWAVLSPRGV